MQFTSIDRIISKYYRDIGENVNESDMIEWIGESLEFMSVPTLQEQALMFSEVSNHHAPIPSHFQKTIQIARYNGWTEQDKKEDKCSPKQIVKEIVEDTDEKECNVPFVMDECCNLIDESQVAYYRPYFDLQWEYDTWNRTRFYKDKFTPVRESKSTFFRTVMCEDENKHVYKGNEDSYTIVGHIAGEQKLRFSFQEVYIAMAYYRNALDSQTGYPLIPDDISVITAIGYYIQWKIAERKAWDGREGFRSISEEKEHKWLKYCTQAKNKAKMPQTLDDWQNLMDQSIHMIPQLNKYYNYFGNFRNSGRYGRKYR